MREFFKCSRVLTNVMHEIRICSFWLMLVDRYVKIHCRHWEKEEGKKFGPGGSNEGRSKIKKKS